MVHQKIHIASYRGLRKNSASQEEPSRLESEMFGVMEARSGRCFWFVFFPRRFVGHVFFFLGCVIFVSSFFCFLHLLVDGSLTVD